MAAIPCCRCLVEFLYLGHSCPSGQSLLNAFGIKFNSGKNAQDTWLQGKRANDKNTRLLDRPHGSVRYTRRSRRLRAGGLAITETLIRSIHQKLVEGVRGGEGKPGAYRLVQNYVVSGKTGKRLVQSTGETNNLNYSLTLKIIQEAPTSEPVIISNVLFNTNPVADAARPEYELSRAMTT